MTQPPQLFGERFDIDPDSVFTALRGLGPVARAELSPGVHGWIVTSYAAAAELLSDTTGVWTRDSRIWAALAEGRVPMDSPVLGILAWRDGILHADGARHARFAAPLRDCMARVQHHRLQAVTTGVANRLLDALVAAGEADLIAGYATRIPLLVFAELLDCSTELSRQMVDSCALIVSGGPRAATGADGLIAVLARLVAQKAKAPGQDLASWMLAHPNKLTHDEITGNLFSLVGAGNVPTSSWISQALRLLLHDDAYAADLTSGTVAVRSAMQRVLWESAPVGTFTFHFARRPALLHGVDIPAAEPVLISHHAVNTDPELIQIGYDSHAHLAWGGGTHRCPVPSHAAIITDATITAFFDRAWDAQLTPGPIPNSPGFFHQCPARLHVTFTPSTPIPAQS